MTKLIWIGLFFCLAGLIDSAGSSTPRYPNLSNYDVTGTDFLNTQTTKLCLLARLNISIEFTYSSDVETLTETIIIPSTASNNGSVCDFDFVSILQLNFQGVSFSLRFRRNEIEATNIGYCQGCENGNWWLEVIYINVSDSSKIIPDAPSTRIVSNVSGQGVSPIAGGFVTGVSLQRGYRCTENILEAVLNVTEAVDMVTQHSIPHNWTIKAYFYAVDIQPFLVTNDIVKDPLLCKDVTLFLIFIILGPLLYFMIFITYYRLKERFGLPKLRTKWPLVSFKTKEGSKKLLVSSSVSNPNQANSDYNNTSTVAITCTTSDGQEMDVLNSDTKH